MANTSSRTLKLLSLLQTHRHWPGLELADRLGVSERTLRRDVDRLRELGYPVSGARGTDGGYQLAPGAVLPPLLLDDEEAVALAVGIGDAAQSGIAGLEDASLRALTKVVRVLPPRLRARVDALRAMTVSAAASGPVVAARVLTAVAQACRDEERLRFGYASRGHAPTEREVEPHRVVALGGRWYLVAYDLDRHDWRSFRLDRLTGPTATGAVSGPACSRPRTPWHSSRRRAGPRLRTRSRSSSTRHPHGCGRWSAGGARSSRSTRTAAGSP